jgi:isoleucyl-tRNA synthetase
VTGSEGTGIVHIAPGCGSEDFELGREHGLVAISPLDDSGHYLERFGDFAGVYAHEAAPRIVDSLKSKGILIGSERYPHRYAHCWRCGTAILYRLVDEWFISMRWRDEIMRVVPQIRWIPDYGEQREMDWLKNMGDWMISKKRYWGLALPIWQCDSGQNPDPTERCDWFDVVGSREELEQRAIAGWDDFAGHSPHRPWVDAVKIRCQRCGSSASRVADVGNPWLDAGIVPYSTLGFTGDRANWERWFPAELVLECFPGQFRNWFYALLAMSTMMQEERWADRTGDGSQVMPPFRTLLGYALVLDEEGREMHKSLGNAIEFNTAAESVGSEVMRYIFAAQNPTTNLRFPDIRPERRSDVVHLDQAVQRTLLTLWNCYSFYVTYAEVDGITPDRLEVPLAERSELDRWIVAKYQGLVRVARDCFEQYRVHLLMQAFEQFLDDLSNWYLRRSRRRFWKSESDVDKLAAFATLYEVLEGCCRLMAPVLPFVTEEVYQNIVRSACPDAPVSVHLRPYPEVEEARLDEELVARIDVVVKYKNLGLSLRNEHSLKVRQPLARMLVRPASEVERVALSTAGLRDQLLEELNVKSLELVESSEGLVRVEVRPNFKALGPKHGPLMKQIQAALAAADPLAVQDAVARGSQFALRLGASEVLLGADDVEVRQTPAAGLAVAFSGGAFVALETTVTPELRREGLARDFVRGVQAERKAVDLDVADRVRLRYHASPEVCEAVAEWDAYIRRETLAVALAVDETLAVEPQFRVGGSPVRVAVERVERS